MEKKENEKINKFLDLARGLKKLWNMKLTVEPIVVGTLGTIPKGQKNQNHEDHSTVKIN